MLNSLSELLRSDIQLNQTIPEIPLDNSINSIDNSIQFHKLVTW